MYTSEEKRKFIEVAESLKKYRRADLIDENGKSILDKLYVDLLPDNIILNKCLLDNTTFLIGRRGTGKSTIFLKLENEYRKKKNYLPCYVDVKTIYESSQAQVVNQQYLHEYFDGKQLSTYLMARNFIQSVLKRIYEEIDLQRVNFFSKIVGNISGNGNEEIKNQIKALRMQIDDNSIMQSVEIPVLQQIKTKSGNERSNSQTDTISANIGNSVSVDSLGMSSKIDGENTRSIEIQNLHEEEYTDILLKVFQVKKVIESIKTILKKMKITKLVVMLDDVSEIDGEALKLFIDTIVAPLNNWSDEFVKFKIAFYPGRVHYGAIDPGKIDKVQLDFYELYSEFDSTRMEENAIDFTKRLLDNRFEYYKLDISKFFSNNCNINDVYRLFFRISMNVPRIIGFLLAYLYQSVIIYNKSITLQDIKNASVKYYDNNINAYFESSTYCMLSLEEKRSISQLIKIRDAIVNTSKEIKSQILKGELSGKLYDKTKPYSSHFHILQEADNYLESLELNHFISKCEERSNRDQKKVNIYCINYGLCEKNNILWGKHEGRDYRTYFIERPFNYTKIILQQIREIKIIKCKGCGRIFSENEKVGLEFTGYKCPTCHEDVEETTKQEDSVVNDLRIACELPQISKDELTILLELNNRTDFVQAKEFAGDVDINSYRLGKICKKMDEDKGLVSRKMDVTPYEYRISERGKKYVINNGDDNNLNS